MVTDGRQHVNVALNRPSFQVSTWMDYLNEPDSANYANDGNRDPNIFTGRCMHTDWATNPWWAVDLLVQLYVAGVIFVNREYPDTGRSNANN